MSENYNLQPDTSSQTVRNGDSYILDTREQLEADMREILMNVCEEVYQSKLGSLTYADSNTLEELLEDAISLLDRQAAITERETRLRELYKFEENHRASIDKTEEVNRNLNERIDELTAERDHLKEQVARFDSISNIDGIANLLVQLEDLKAERDELREALDACGTCTMYELWRKDHARLEAIRAALHDNPGT